MDTKRPKLSGQGAVVAEGQKEEEEGGVTLLVASPVTSTDDESLYSSSDESCYASDTEYDSDSRTSNGVTGSSKSNSDDEERQVCLPRRPTATAEELTPMQGRDIIARTFAEMLQNHQVKKSRIDAYM